MTIARDYPNRSIQRVIVGTRNVAIGIAIGNDIAIGIVGPAVLATVCIMLERLAPQAIVAKRVYPPLSHR